MKPKLDNRKIIALIPARSGSKGVQNKNIRVLGNRSLIEHACDWCDKQNWIDDFYISTDSQYYMQMAVEAKAKSLSLRNKSLSSDIASSVSVLDNRATLDVGCSLPDIFFIYASYYNLNFVVDFNINTA